MILRSAAVMRPDSAPTRRQHDGPGYFAAAVSEIFRPRQALLASIASLRLMRCRSTSQGGCHELPKRLHDRGFHGLATRAPLDTMSKS